MLKVFVTATGAECEARGKRQAVRSLEDSGDNSKAMRNMQAKDLPRTTRNRHQCLERLNVCQSTRRQQSMDDNTKDYDVRPGRVIDSTSPIMLLDAQMSGSRLVVSFGKTVQDAEAGTAQTHSPRRQACLTTGPLVPKKFSNQHRPRLRLQRMHLLSDVIRPSCPEQTGKVAFLDSPPFCQSQFCSGSFGGEANMLLLARCRHRACPAAAACRRMPRQRVWKRQMERALGCVQAVSSF